MKILLINSSLVLIYTRDLRFADVRSRLAAVIRQQMGPLTPRRMAHILQVLKDGVLYRSLAEDRCLTGRHAF